MTKPLIVIAAGGTGGHMMPASALVETLQLEGYRVMLITDQRGDSLSTGMTEIPRMVTGAASHMAGGLFGKLKSLISIFNATLNVRKRLIKDKPAAVIGFGGYPSLPPLLAARLLGIPFLLHEQNAVLGRVNRMMAKKAARVALSYEETARVPQGAKTVVTGNPVRRVIGKLSNIAYSVPFGFGDIRILVLGGSQGARILSDVVPSALHLLGDDWRRRLVVSHQARPEDVERVKKTYRAADIRAEVSPFFEDVAALMIKTQLVIARAGASTLAECATMARPAVLVPLRIAADDHQSANAALHEAVDGAWVLKERKFTVDGLYDLLLDLFDEDLAKLRSASEGMRLLSMADAASTLASHVIAIADPAIDLPPRPSEGGSA